MARQTKIDRGLSSRLDEFEERLFLLKINYEKFFMGIEAKEPIRERDALQRQLRELLKEPIFNTAQKREMISG